MVGPVPFMALLLLSPLAAPPPLDEPSETSLIIQYDTPPDAADLARLAELATVVRVYQVIPAAHVRADPGAADRIGTLPGVERVDPDEPLRLALDSSRAAIGAGPSLLDRGLRGEGVTVAVVDTGIDGTHPGLASRIRTGVVLHADGTAEEVERPTDQDGHGTHVAGVLAGTGQGAPTQGLQGVAPGAELVSLDMSQALSTATAVAAFDWIHLHHREHGLSVVQNSWGRDQPGGGFDPGDPLVRASDRLVLDDGLVVVFAASNHGPAGASLPMEAQNPNVLTVGASDDDGAPASFSGRGPVLLKTGGRAPWVKPDLVAPGIDVTSPFSDGRYEARSGTSQSAPHVAGAVAVLRAAAPDLTPSMIHALLRGSARDVGAPGPDDVSGHGMLDVRAALAAALGTTDDEGLTIEHIFRARGRLAPDLPGGASLERIGAPSEANGTLEAPEGALHLSFELAWTSMAREGPAPALLVTLRSPGGERFEVPVGEGRASLALPLPEVGTWRWQATMVPDAGARPATYLMEGEVLAPRGAPEASARSFASGDAEPVPSPVAARIQDDAGGRLVLTGLAVVGALAIAVGLRGRRPR